MQISTHILEWNIIFEKVISVLLNILIIFCFMILKWDGNSQIYYILDIYSQYISIMFRLLQLLHLQLRPIYSSNLLTPQLATADVFCIYCILYVHILLSSKPTGLLFSSYLWVCLDIVRYFGSRHYFFKHLVTTYGDFGLVTIHSLCIRMILKKMSFFKLNIVRKWH